MNLCVSVESIISEITADSNGPGSVSHQTTLSE